MGYHRCSKYSQNLLLDVAHRNIQRLTQLIYTEGIKIGKYIDVKIEHRSIEDHYKTMS